MTVLVWLVYGPRGWITWRTVLASLAIPLAWIGWMLARGAVIVAYPYGLANVSTLGYGPVLATLSGILVFGLVVASVFWGIDAGRGRLVSRRSSGRAR